MNNSQAVIRKLERLSDSSINEQDCRLLIKIIDSYPHKSTICAAQEYSNELLNAPKTIEIAGKSMKAKPSAALANLCEYYLRSSPCEHLRWVIEAVFETRVRPKLYKLIAKRLEENSNCRVWNIVLSKPSRNKRVEALTHRFFELGNDFEELDVFYTSHFTKDSKTIEYLFDWQKRNHEVLSSSTAVIVMNLLRISYWYHQEYYPKIENYARKWVKTYPEAELCSFVHSTLIRTSDSRHDYKIAKNWYQESKSARKWGILLAMQERALKQGKKSDQFAISELNRLALNTKHSRMHPGLAAALLKYCKSRKVAQVVKEVYFKTRTRFLLYDLMKYAPDDELLQHVKSENQKYYTKHKYYSCFFSCIILETEPQLKRSIKMAKNSLRYDDNELYSKKLRKLLKKIET